MDASDSRAELCMRSWKLDAQMLFPGTLFRPRVNCNFAEVTVSDKLMGSCHGDEQMHTEREGYRKNKPIKIKETLYSHLE